MGGGSKRRTRACNGSEPGRRLRMDQVRPSARRRKAGIQAGSDDRRFPAAGAADQGDEVVVTQLAEEGVDGLLAAEEKASIFLTKRQQAAIGAQRLAQRAGFGGRLAAQAGQQHIELGGVGDIGAEIDPGLQAQKAAGRVLDLGQQDGDDREGAAAALGLGLPVESELDLALLPGAKPAGPTRTTTAVQRAMACSRAGSQGWPAGSWSRSRKVAKPACFR